VEDRSYPAGQTNMLEALSAKIDRISCEVIEKYPKLYLQSLKKLTSLSQEFELLTDILFLISKTDM